MRTTLAIADDILRDLKALARRRRTSLTRVANEVLRAGLVRQAEPEHQRRPYREKVVDLGNPNIDLDRALEIAARLEDEETLRKLAIRK